MSDEMRTEMFYVLFPKDDEEYEMCDKEDAQGTAVIFTALHPVELTDEGNPQEYGIRVISTEIYDAVADIEEFAINAAVQALKDAGCLVGDTVGTGTEPAEAPKTILDEDYVAPIGCACQQNDD